MSSSASPYYRTKLRGLYTTAKADAEAECGYVDAFAVAEFALCTSLHQCKGCSFSLKNTYYKDDSLKDLFWTFFFCFLNHLEDLEHLVVV